MKLRIKFSKKGAMKFIGHLDVMRYFQKAMRRACVDIAYSEGFSPHQIMSFAAPLGVGLESEGEYLDIRVNGAPPANELSERLNSVMVEGIRVLSVKKLPDNVKNAMACVEAASYLAELPEGCVFKMDEEELRERAAAFLSQEQIPVLKKTKRSEAVVDIRPMIHEFSPEAGGRDSLSKNRSGIRLLLSQGSAANLKPEPVLKAFYDFCSLPFPEPGFSLTRLDLYRRADGGFLPLSGEGEDF